MIISLVYILYLSKEFVNCNKQKTSSPLFLYFYHKQKTVRDAFFKDSLTIFVLQYNADKSARAFIDDPAECV